MKWTQPAADRRSAEKHVLIVDDSATVRIDLRAALHEAGLIVTACTSKASAQKLLKTRPFDLYILDVVLDDGTGIELLKEIRETPGIDGAPVILLSSEAEVRHRVRGLRVGANDYIGKPYNRHYLINRARELARAATDEGATSAASPVEKKILVVDDSPTYAERLKAALQEEGHEIVIAASGEEAMELLAVDRVDAIVLDLHMPGMSGFEACRRIRAERPCALVPMLMLTGFAEHDELRAECLTAGADDVAVKSPELGLVKVRLRGLLQGGRRETESSSGPVSGISGSGPVSDVSGGGPSSRDWEGPTSAGRSSLWTLPPTSSPMPDIEAAPGTLLARVVAATGIAPAIGTGAVARACARAGVSAAEMTGANLRKALPALRQMLLLFVPAEEVEDRMNALSLLASLADGTAGRG